MLILTSRFGEIEIPDEEILKFPDGIPGFLEEKSFVLLPYQPDSPFSFLQSTTDANLAFLTVNPFAFFKDYIFELGDQIVNELNLSKENPPFIINLVTVPDKIENMTANLLAPVIINRQSRIGRQIVLEKTNYTTKERLFKGGK